MATSAMITKHLAFLLKKEAKAMAQWQSQVATNPLEALHWISGGLHSAAGSFVLEHALEASKHRTPQELLSYVTNTLTRLGASPPHSTGAMDLWIWAYTVASWCTVVRELEQLGSEE